MARLRTRVERAAAFHRHASAVVAAASQALEGYSPASAPVEQYAEQYELAARLRAAAADLAPGWLGASLDAMPAIAPIGDTVTVTHLRIGQAHPLDDARFPAIVPLLGVGHLAIDADARDPRVAGLLRSVVLRLLSGPPPGTVVFRAVDALAGETVAPFAAVPAEILPPAVTDHAGLQRLLAEAEELVRRPRGANDPFHVLVIASLPQLTDGGDLARIVRLARAGPAAGLHLVIAGWPPPPLTAETTQPPLPLATQVALRNPHVWVGDPPGATFSGSGVGPARLNSPVYLDPDPPPAMLARVCAQLAERPARAAGPEPAPPDPRWSDYVRSAQRMDAVRRSAASMVNRQTAAVKTAREEIKALKKRLAAQQPRLSAAVEQVRGTVAITPMPEEIAAAQAGLNAAPAPGGASGRGSQTAARSRQAPGRGPQAAGGGAQAHGGGPQPPGNGPQAPGNGPQALGSPDWASKPSGGPDGRRPPSAPGRQPAGYTTGQYPVVPARPPAPAGYTTGQYPAVAPSGHATGQHPVMPGHAAGQHPAAPASGHAAGQHPATPASGHATGQRAAVPPSGHATGQHPVIPAPGHTTGQHPIAPAPGQATGQYPVVPSAPPAYRPAPDPSTGYLTYPTGQHPIVASAPPGYGPHPTGAPTSGPAGRPLNPTSGPAGQPPRPTSGPAGQPPRPTSGPAGQPPGWAGAPPASPPGATGALPVHASPPPTPRTGPPPGRPASPPQALHSGAFPVGGASGTARPVSGPWGAGKLPVSGPPAPPPSAPAPGGPPRLPEAVLAMLATGRSTAEHAEAALTDLETRSGTSTGLRNTLVYGALAAVFALVQLPLLIMSGFVDRFPMFVLLPCGLVATVMSFALGWTIIGVAFRPRGGSGHAARTPGLGLVVSLLAAAPTVIASVAALA